MNDATINHWLLLGQAGMTLFMAGLIWFVQVVHYPLLGRVGPAEFVRYEREHTRRTGWVVALPMVGELLIAIALAWRMGGVVPLTGLAILAVIWASTWLWQVPAHARLEQDFDAATWRRLVRTNWVRTFGWSARGLIALVLMGAQP